MYNEFTILILIKQHFKSLLEIANVLSMKNRFIVLIDFSPYSEHLIQFAHDWGKRVNAEILLLHNTIVMSPVMASHESKIELTRIANRDALEKLQLCASAAIPEAASVQYLASEKKLVYQLKALLREPYNNLVFMGLKGTGLLKKIFIGSEAVKIIEDIDNLIVAMPRNAECCSHEFIHVAVQKNYPLNIVDFDKFLRFAGDQIHKIIFFSVITPDHDPDAAEKYLKELSEFYSDKRNTSYELYRGSRGFEDLKRILSEKKNEFIVVQRGSRMFLDRVSRKFLINELVYEGNIPLVILP